MHETVTVMISSTALDLPQHRAQARDACLILDMMPKMMENFGAADRSALKTSLGMVDQADVYVGIIAHRYGFIPPGHERSITELEFQRATDRGIPRLMFLAHPEHPFTEVDFEFGAGKERLDALKRTVQAQAGIVVDFFKSPEDLRAQIIAALAKLPKLEEPDGARRAAQRQPLVPRPCFFRSISSHECFINPADALAAVRLAGPMPFLVSAFDLVHNKDRDSLLAELKSLATPDHLILLDSGHYEASRKDAEWLWDDYAKVVESVPFNIACCFDVASGSQDPETIAAEIIVGHGRDSQVAPVERLAPVIKLDDPTQIPEVAVRVAQATRPPLLAIPERKLGDGIVERAATVYRIRSALEDGLDRYQPIHLLGTGNPLSIAILAAAGADSFDGLEWCRTVADHETARLYHAQHYDFLAHQGQRESLDEFFRSALAPESDYRYLDRIALHNLAFLELWMERITMKTASGDASWLAEFVPEQAYCRLHNAVPQVFK